MKRKTRLDHEERIAEALRFIVEHLDEDISLPELADRLCYSRFYFHRLFQGLLGETVGEVIRRLRLERAANCLRTSKTPITVIAFEAGYATHEAFIRAFRSVFACTPSYMRRKSSYNGLLPTPNGVHYGVMSPIRFIETQGEIGMEVEIRTLESRKIVCMPHTGPYYMIGATFDALAGWLKENQVEVGLTAALYYDDPDVTPVEQLRSDAGAFVPDDFTTNDTRVQVKEITGGLYAVTTHIGHYDGLNSAWGRFVGEWLPSSGYTFPDTPCFEVYLDDCSVTPPAEVRTELCIALKVAAD